LRALFSHWLEGRRAHDSRYKEQQHQTLADRLQERDKSHRHHRKTSSSNTYEDNKTNTNGSTSKIDNEDSNSTSGREKEKDKDKEADGDGDKDKEGDRDKDREKEREKDRERDRDGRTRDRHNSGLGKSSSTLKKSDKLPPPTSNGSSHHASGSTNSNSSNDENTNGNGGLNDKQRPLPQFSIPSNISVIISEETGATMHRSLLSQLDGAEPAEILPQWVVDCLLHNEMPSREAAKIGFYLTTVDEKECPQLPQGANRLSAHKLLKIRKVAHYVVTKLELDVPTKTPKTPEAENSSNSADDNSSCSDTDNVKNEAASGEKVASENYIEILCNNKVLPPNINLATARAFFWKAGDDLVLNYRINPEYSESSDKKSNKIKAKKSKLPKLHKSGLLAKSRG